MPVVCWLSDIARSGEAARNLKTNSQTCFGGKKVIQIQKSTSYLFKEGMLYDYGFKGWISLKVLKWDKEFTLQNIKTNKPILKMQKKKWLEALSKNSRNNSKLKMTPQFRCPQGPTGCLKKQTHSLNSNLVVWCTKIETKLKKFSKNYQKNNVFNVFCHYQI